MGPTPSNEERQFAPVGGAAEGTTSYSACMPRHLLNHRRCQANGAAAGFTLIETCTVVAVVAVLAAAAVPSLRPLIDARRLEGAATELATDVQLARSEAVARNRPVRLSLQKTADGSCYLIHTGNAGDCSCATSGPAVCSGAASAIKRVSALAADGVGFASNSASVVFDPLHGTCTPAATLRVLGRPGREIDQVVNVMGRVRSCSPNAAVGGYRAC